MKAIDFDNMSDEEFAKMFEEFDNKITSSCQHLTLLPYHLSPKEV